ncbi:RNA-binding protein [Candidatus Woesearchaeota archaeon]|nr:RNA-binding protein [Candidatus Woesearchaeota archaeon]
MSELKVSDKAIVVPGELLAQGMDFLPSFGTYRIKEDIRAARLGLLKVDGKVLKIIPLSGRYIPKRGDTIIGQVSDIMIAGWRLSTNSPYEAVLGMKDATSEFIERGSDLSKYYALGDYIVTKIINVTSQKLVDITMRGPGLRKLLGGRVIEVNTNKVPRIIGKLGSMVSMIKDATGVKIVVGQNGLIWLEGEAHMENIAVEAIRKIEKEGHLSGLTDKIKDFLTNKLKEVTK